MEKTKTYMIGERGTADGLVFYDKGSYSDGWRYLECASAQYEFTAKWGAFEKEIKGTTESVGDGMKNTKLVADFLKNIGETDTATQRCLSLEINGYSDWFLPTKDELNLIYSKLAQNGHGDFSKEWYWSSSLYHDQNTWVQNFDDGSQGKRYENVEAKVRACRVF
jgi:hypothetical protein